MLLTAQLIFLLVVFLVATSFIVPHLNSLKTEGHLSSEQMFISYLTKMVCFSASKILHIYSDKHILYTNPLSEQNVEIFNVVAGESKVFTPLKRINITFFCM